MQVKVLASGSDANCVWVSNGTTNILIDIGLPARKTEEIMLSQDVNPSKISAIFISHEHKDHCRGLGLAKKYKIPVYASGGTLRMLEIEDGLTMPKNGGVTLGDAVGGYIMVSGFPVWHDAKEPLGYTLSTVDCKVTVLMDTGKVDDVMMKAMYGSNIYVFECNHDSLMLENGIYADSLKARVSGDLGHLSNQTTAKALSRLVKGKGERIYLSHMSSNNNNPSLAKKTVKIALKQHGYILDEHYTMEVV